MAVPSKDKGTYWLAVAAGVAGGMVLCMLMAFAVYLFSPSSGSTTLPEVLAPMVKLDPVSVTGRGDAVLDVAQYSGYGKVRFVHNGKSNFAVETFDGTGDLKSLLVNEIGSYDGTVMWDRGAVRVQITADGGWSMTLEQ